MRKSAAFIRGRRFIIFLLVTAAFIRGRRLFEGGVYSSKYGILTLMQTLINCIKRQDSYNDNPTISYDLDIQVKGTDEIALLFWKSLPQKACRPTSSTT